MIVAAGEENPTLHQSVLYHESLTYLQVQSGERFVDGTLGAGGHAAGILKGSKSHALLLGFDLDPQAITLAKKKLVEFGKRAIVQQRPYAEILTAIKELGWQCVNGVLLDLGVSSMQIDIGEKGFSFTKPAPLDMRFDQSSGYTAAHLLNTLDEKEIADIIWKFGEEPKARRIASLIIENRPVTNTTQLAQIINQVYSNKDTKRNPATRTFQAIRIAVNHELEVLEQGLENTLASLCSGGRLAVITFHSLEDRIVKQLFRLESKDCICPPEQIICNCGHKATIKLVTKKPVKPSEDELRNNPRARSAKLRVVEKI
jgi:16S rRNA (cytosine1402-N4)-methyltransferase